MPDGKSILGSIEEGQEVLIEDGVAKLRIVLLSQAVLLLPTDWYELPLK